MWESKFIRHWGKSVQISARVRHGARVPPLELVPVPGHGAQMCARAPTKGYVQTRAHAQAPGTGAKSERGLSLLTAVFNWVNWVIRVCSPSSHFLKQSEVKPIMTCSHAFSRAWRRLHVFASGYDWFIVLLAFVVIGQINYVGFGFTTVLTYLRWRMESLGDHACTRLYCDQSSEYAL